MTPNASPQTVSIYHFIARSPLRHRQRLGKIGQPGSRTCQPGRSTLTQMPPYHENPCSGDEDPQTLPKFFVVWESVIRERYFRLIEAESPRNAHTNWSAVGRRNILAIHT